MPLFKPKTNKALVVDTQKTITLDNKHSEILDNFQLDEEVEIPKLKQKIKSLKKILKIKKVNLTSELEIKDKIKDIENKIIELKNKKKSYLLENSSLVFDYFENKKNIANENSQVKVLDSFFNINNNNDIEQNNKKDQTLVNTYLSNIDDSFINMEHFMYKENLCYFCYKGEFIPIDDEGVLVCNNCSKQIPYLIENERPSYKEPPKEVCFYAYKRINHFREILAQFQAKESTQIPEQVIEDIKNQIKKERIDLKQITNNKAKEILKKLGYNKYYEHIPFIKDIIGIKPPVMSPELEETLCNLFMEIQAPYAKFCPDDRVNFLNYYYTVYKLCELLNQKQFLPFFPMLKDREKRIEQDVVWKKICNQLDWEFIPTV
tara:strand:- start:238 stop:1365 length:1128 start_codon:yes stop_codon:yes gene_type:complete